MSHDGLNEIKTGYISSLISLFASSSTLICCAIPALLVSLGAGATLASLVAVFPKIVWISEHKEAIFVLSSGLMFIGGVLQWRNRNAPCPIDPKQRDTCFKNTQDFPTNLLDQFRLTDYWRMVCVCSTAFLVDARNA